MGPVLLREVILPSAVYYVAHRQGVSNVSALALGGAVNTLFVVVGLVRKRRVEMLGVIVLITFALGAAASYMTGNARFAPAKDSVITGGVGIAFLASLPAARPITYLMTRQMLTSGDPSAAAAMDARWPPSPGTSGTAGAVSDLRLCGVDEAVTCQDG
ncbi:VC0807 family protein [Streptomyces sp. NPDC002092]